MVHFFRSELRVRVCQQAISYSCYRILNLLLKDLVRDLPHVFFQLNSSPIVDVMSSFKLDHGESLHLMFFTEVQNVAEVVESFAQTLSNCTIINPELILDPFQVLIAANKAVVSKFSNTMITKNLCTELLFNLSISDNITDSLQKFGYGSQTNSLLVALFGSDHEQQQSIMSRVQGKFQSLSSLTDKCNMDSIRKTYDVTEEQESTAALLDLIVTKIACKSL